MQEKFPENRNFKEMRESLGLTLAQLSEMSGYSISTINLLEVKGEGSKRLREKLTALLLSGEEKGETAHTEYWRDRALAAEEKLKMLKSAMQGWLSKI